MQSTRAFVAGVLALAMLATCHPRQAARSVARRALPPPLPVIEPLVPPSSAVPVPGAASEVRHPRDGMDDTDLGARVAARTLPLPQVGLGRSARFTFESGQRRGWVLQLAAGSLLATPAYAQGRVYVGAGFTSNTVYALDAHTGALRWTGATPDGGPTAAIVEDGTVLFNTESCTLFAFDARTGRQRWSRWLGDPLMSQPSAADGRVFSAYPDTDAPQGFSFAALSARSGRVLWSRPVRGDVMTAAVVSGNDVYFATMDGSLYRMRADNGHRVWVRSLGATSAPVVHGGQLSIAQRVRGGRERQVLLSAVDGHSVSAGDSVRAPYAALRPDTGGVEAGWSHEGSRPTYADGRLYYAMGDEVVARDAANGRVVWRRRYPLPVSRRGVTSPAVAGSEVVIGTRDGNLFGLDIDTGATTWAYRVGEPIAFQPTVANGWIYASTARGKVLGIEVADRSLDGWHMWGGNARHNGPSAPEAISASTADDRPSQGTLRALAEGEAGFALVGTAVRAEVSGYVARVEVEQSFSNPFTRNIDAEYLFPLPPNAAVDAMDVHIGARVIRGEIQRREAARAAYRAARDCGQRAALLEQDRPDLFRQRVANIPPGESIRVVIRFAASVPYHNGHYEFAFPLTSGARPAAGVSASAAPGRMTHVALSARIDLGTELEEIASPSHPVTVTRDPNHRVTVTLDNTAVRPDRDFVLRYRPRVRSVEPSVVATREGAEGFFSLMLHPDTGAPAGEISPRELVFLADTSSSMRGAPLRHQQVLLHRAIDRLREGDTFRVVRFSDTVSEIAPGFLAATPEHRVRAHAFVDAMVAVGATDMLPALRAVMGGASDPARVRMVVLLTDGYVGNEREVLAAVQREAGASRVFAFGVGPAVNRYLLEQVAEAGRGHAEVVLPSEDPAAAADRFYAHVDRPYLTDIAVDWGGLDVSDVYPRIVPDLFADRPVLVHARYRAGGTGEVRITGRVRGRAFSRTLRVVLPADAHDHEALPSVWARARIHDLSRAMLLGETPELREEITLLGLRHRLVTDYTSFVALDNEGSGAACRGRVPGANGNSLSSVGYGGGMGIGSLAYGTAGESAGDRISAGRGFAAREAPGPMLRASPPVVAGMMSPQIIRRDVSRNLPQVRHCYEQALVAHPTLAGRVEIRLVIDERGAVIASQVASNSMPVLSVGQCIVAASRSWRFAESSGGTTTVNYPFVFDAAPARPPRIHIPVPIP